MRPERPVASRHFVALGAECSAFALGLTDRHLTGVEEWVRSMGARLTRFSPDSELSQLNSSEGRWIDVSHDITEVLRAALDAFERSAGLVNIAVLPSMIAIGYTKPLIHGTTPATLEDARPPRPLPEVLELRDGQARLRPGCALDLGGIAKGWMADRLCAQLKANVLVNLGGDLFAAGRGPSGEGWPVGLGRVTLMLRDQGAATSSVRKRRWDGLHHLIDPRTGLPARSGLDEVAVVADTGVLAEVVAKTALLLGPELAPLFCASHALAWSLTKTDDD